MDAVPLCVCASKSTLPAGLEAHSSVESFLLGVARLSVRAPRGQSDLGAVKVTSKFRDNLSNSPRLPEKPRACPHFTQAEAMYCLNRHKALEAKLVT